jgi:hypothetical protein
MKMNPALKVSSFLSLSQIFDACMSSGLSMERLRTEQDFHVTSAAVAWW